LQGGAVAGTGAPLGHVPAAASGASSTNWASYFQASNFTVAIGFLGIDYYATAYNAGVRLDKSGANNFLTIAAGYSPVLSIGVLEMGSTAVTGVVPGPAVISAWLSYLQSFLVGWVLAGHTTIDCIWFDGPGLGNCIVNGSDFRIPLLQSFIAGVTAPQVTGINAGA